MEGCYNFQAPFGSIIYHISSICPDMYLQAMSPDADMKISMVDKYVCMEVSMHVDDLGT